MTGPEHYRQAEQVIAQVENRDVTGSAVAAFAAVAQVHATLALAAAHVAGVLMHPGERAEWDRATGRLPDSPEVTR